MALGFSPHSPSHLERPVDERMHIRRPSDEASNILRKFSGAGLQYVPNIPMNLGVSLPEKAMSFPRQASLTLKAPPLIMTRIWPDTIVSVGV